MAIRMVDLLHGISISVEHSFGPWQTVVWTVEFELRTYLKESRVLTGIHVVRTVAALFP
jgi:hypothetical protein